MNRALKGILWTLGAYAGLQLGARVIRRQGSGPMPALLSWLGGLPFGPWRLDIGEVLWALDLEGGQHVLELGAQLAGVTGAIADTLGATGRLVAVDPRPAVLQSLVAAVPGLTNLSTQAADPRDVPCPEGSFDRVLVATGFGGFVQPGRVAKEAFRVLKPHGYLVVAEEARDADFLRERLVLDLALAAGFVLKARSGGPWRYVLVFERPAGPTFLHAPHEEHRIETYG